MSRHSVIGDSLAKSAMAARQIGPQEWTAVLPTGARLVARADQSAGWLVLELLLAGGMSANHPSFAPWAWLERSGRLAAPIKLVRCPGSWTQSLRADIALDEDADIAARVREACAALVTGEREIVDLLAGVEDPFAPPLPSKPNAPIDLAALCTDAGWAYTEPKGSMLRVDLGVAAHEAPARVEQAIDGSVRVHVDLVRRDAVGLSLASRDAIGLFLLTGSAIVRLARAYVCRSTDDLAVGFEVRYAMPPTSGQLGHALSALSVACAWFGGEARGLSDDRIARAYLAMRDRQGAVVDDVREVAGVSGRRSRVGHQ